MNIKERICLALDVDKSIEALEIVKELKYYCGYFKVGSQLFTREGPSIVEKIISFGTKVFLDLKYYDIPNTVKNAAAVAVRLNVSIFNIHAIGGSEMMSETADLVKEESLKIGIQRPLIFGVTVLTSIKSQTLTDELKINLSLNDYVVHLSKLAQKSGLDGVVASPLEIDIIRQACGPDFKILTPGVRPSWAVEVHDQKRVMTPKEAIDRGADYIVLGRPIIKAPDPKKAAKKLIKELSTSST